MWSQAQGLSSPQAHGLRAVVNLVLKPAEVMPVQRMKGQLILVGALRPDLDTPHRGATRDGLPNCNLDLNVCLVADLQYREAVVLVRRDDHDDVHEGTGGVNEEGRG